MREMTLEAGVSLALARERARRISDLRVSIRLSLPADRSAPIPGIASIAFSLADAALPLVLDFAPNANGRLDSIEVNGIGVDSSVRLEHIVCPSFTLRTGPNEIRLRFVAGDAPLNRRDDLLYTIFVPARAREAFPCFDQPDLKARWSLTLEVPDGWVAVSNTDTIDTTDALGDRKVVSFNETTPLPAYLFAFAAGQFLEDIVDVDGRELRIYHVAGDAAALEENRDALVLGHTQALSWLERYTAIPYPFDKLDLVLLPAFQFGGMEHPGAIFYGAAGVLLTASATRQQRLARANVIAHETAHMWFGNLVTMTWFDDVWMKEVFANFLAAKIVNPEFPDLDHDLRFLHAHYPAAYDVDRTAGANPIRQRLDNLNDAGSLYGAIIYLKGPIVMRQLELLLGETVLCEALREYLRRFAFGNASWPDLLEILAARSPIDLRAWSREWIEEPGRPLMGTVLTLDNDRIVRLELSTPDRQNRGDRIGPAWTLTYPQALHVAACRENSVLHTEVWSDGTVLVPAFEGLPAPDFVLPNGHGLAYGEFHLDEPSLSWLLTHLPEVPDALTRGSAWLTLWDEMLARHVGPEPLLDLALRAIDGETSELNLQRMLTCLERLFWIFIEPSSRTECASHVETVLRGALDAAGAAATQAALFTTLRAVAVCAPTLTWLRMLWEGEQTIDGLELQEADLIGITLELAVREGDGSDLVAEQIARTRAGERRDALTFIAGAVSASESDRDRFFDTILDARNRRREPWVIDGLRWLNHPLRTAGSVKYIRPALDCLEEVKRTGDIFMPKRWLDALLGGHRSSDAARQVREFLEERPDYSPFLRRTILASADQLFRASH
jgi:aminopeptidase N